MKLSVKALAAKEDAKDEAVEEDKEED